MNDNTSSIITRWSPRLVALLAALIVPLGAQAQTTQETLTTLAQRISEKRAQVEDLSNQVDLAKTQYNEQLRSLAAQRGDVETQINREQLRLSQIEQDLEQARAEISRTRSSVEDLEPLVAQVLVQLRSYISQGLPFQVPERLGEVETLEQLLQEGSLETELLLTRIWNMVESEFRLTSESGLYRQTITVAGEDQLAEVARLGTVMLYFRTFDGRYGFASPTEDGWTYVIAEGREGQQQLATLFDSLRRNLREGFFTVPNPYNEG